LVQPWDFEECELSHALVTGGAGFIGSHLVRGLLEQGYTVRVLDDLSTGFEENLASLDVDLWVGDIRDRELVMKAMGGVASVFHYAAMISVPESIEQPFYCYDVNVNGTLNVLWSACKADVSKVILASSAAVYGENSDPVHEETVLDPKSPYASSKIAMEGLAKMFTTTYGLPTVCLRYFNVYGPRQSPDSPYAAAIPLFIDALISGEPPIIYGDGLQTRDFVYIEDIIRANLLSATSEKANGKILNIAGQGPVTILELVHQLKHFFPDTPEPIFQPPRSGDIRYSSADQSKAQEALGYRPIIGLEQGLQHTVQWFQLKKSREGL
jgi:nucleoside-diphosphate-sugar epimerase